MAVISETIRGGERVFRIQTTPQYEKTTERGRVIKVLDPHGVLEGKDGFKRVEGSGEQEKEIIIGPNVIPHAQRYDLFSPSPDRVSSIPKDRTPKIVFSAK